MTSHRRIVAASVALLATTVACGDTDSGLAGVDHVDTSAVNTSAVNTSAVNTSAVNTSAVNTSATSPTDGEFCDAMSHLIVLLAPAGNTSPDATKAAFAEAAGWFEKANRAAPATIAADFAAYKTAYDEYVHYLSTVGFNLDAVFSTPEGRKLAIDTSHTLTPAIVDHVVSECHLSFGDEQHDPPATTTG